MTEYLVWRTEDREFDWFVLADGDYRKLAPDAKGLCRSVTLPGLVLNVPALLAENGAVVLHTLHGGLKTKGHREFVDLLAALKP